MNAGTGPGICEHMSLQVSAMTAAAEAKARVRLSALLSEVPELQNGVWVSCLVCCDPSDDCCHTNPGATSLPLPLDVGRPGP